MHESLPVCNFTCRGALNPKLAELSAWVRPTGRSMIPRWLLYGARNHQSRSRADHLQCTDSIDASMSCDVNHGGWFAV